MGADGWYSGVFIVCVWLWLDVRKWPNENKGSDAAGRNKRGLRNRRRSPGRVRRSAGLGWAHRHHVLPVRVVRLDEDAAALLTKEHEPRLGQTPGGHLPALDDGLNHGGCPPVPDAVADVDLGAVVVEHGLEPNYTLSHFVSV